MFYSQNFVCWGKGGEGGVIPPTFSSLRLPPLSSKEDAHSSLVPRYGAEMEYLHESSW